MPPTVAPQPGSSGSGLAEVYTGSLLVEIRSAADIIDTLSDLMAAQMETDLQFVVVSTRKEERVEFIYEEGLPIGKNINMFVHDNTSNKSRDFCAEQKYEHGFIIIFMRQYI